MANHDVVKEWDRMGPLNRDRIIRLASYEQLVKWASDPECNQREKCVAALDKRNAELAARAAALQANPFDLRTELSADARYIVKHLWIIFVALPFILAALYEILR